MNFNIYDTSKHTVLLNGDYLTFQLEPIDLNTVEMVILSPTTVPTIINSFTTRPSKNWKYNTVFQLI